MSDNAAKLGSSGKLGIQMQGIKVSGSLSVFLKLPLGNSFYD